MDKNQALGLPRGSVRAILALALVAASIGLAYLGQLDPSKLEGLAEIVVIFYFGAKLAAK